MTILLVIAILVVLIVVHELGHFIAAKLSGVRVEEFGVGYPPRAYTIAKIGATEYTINWLPFGGFVRLYGDESNGTRGPGSLAGAPRWKQAIILVAGVTMNALMAWVLFTIAFHAGVPQRINAASGGEPTKVIVTEVVPGSPAAVAGISPGDQITDITDPTGARVIDGITPEGVVAFVSARGGVPLFVSFAHAGATSTARIIPANAVIPGAAGRPALGVGLSLVATRPIPWPEAAQMAGRETVATFKSVAHDLGGLVLGMLRAKPDLAGVVGPVGIVNYVGQASENGMSAVLILAALISVNLAIVNLAPIPALDGGRIFVLAVEAALRREAPRLAIQVLNTLGVALIILLMVVVTYHDIARLLT